VEGEGDIAVSAAKDVFAGGTEDQAAVSSSVEQQDCLLFFFKDLTQLSFERGGDEIELTPGNILSHIDEFHFRQGQVHHPFREFHKVEMLSGSAVVEGFERGCSAAEDAVATCELCPFYGDVPAVVSRDGVLLVALLVLFIDDDDAEVFNRSKDSGAGADDHVSFALFYFSPLVVTL